MRQDEAIRFMYLLASEDVQVGREVDYTSLAEQCAAHFGEDEIDGPLDDPNHDIWDWAIDAARRAGYSL